MQPADGCLPQDHIITTSSELEGMFKEHLVQLPSNEQGYPEETACITGHRDKSWCGQIVGNKVVSYPSLLRDRKQGNITKTQQNFLQTGAKVTFPSF